MKAASLTWRTQLQKFQLVSQISTVLLQRKDWASLLSTFNLRSELTTPLFLQVLNKIQPNPEISLNFFNWAKSNLGFQPDLKTHCKIIQISIRSGRTARIVKPLLDSLIQVHPPTQILDSMTQASKCTEFQPLIFSSLIECYAEKGLYFESLEIYKNVIFHGFVPYVRCCNSLLDVLALVGEFRLAWCFICSMIRNGVSFGSNTWSIIALILCKNEKLETVLQLLNSGVYNSVMFNLVIDSYSKQGNFEAAFVQLNLMHDLNLEPGFSTYSSILDGACKFRNVNVVETIMQSVIEQKLMSLSLPSDYDILIKKFCDLGKTYAAEMMFRRAEDEGFGLNDSTIGCLLRSYSREGRVKEALCVYDIILQKGFVVGDSSYREFAGILSQQNPSEESNKILIDLINRGASPSPMELSKLMKSQSKEGKWQEMEVLLNLILDKGIMTDYSSCRLLIKHYCSCGKIDSAMFLHRRLEKSGSIFDVTTYNQLLRGLFAEKRIEEAVEMFDYMRKKSVISCASFLVMISGLCHEKEMRKVMKLHDEMLKMGLKPSAKTYKNLISVFR
ncbi:hypothetical protein Nepgr_021301 [Nepenthes gracilis]|uniref:Pentatricopeptide repeat-containing protein n=1 Tax=Nepenthes gracilis TaxID=150966 RepID=A0AAD3SX49_NEPGR|nr:hypothetical protein Nepgr_021301 [Nepenthes gracilis]